MTTTDFATEIRGSDVPHVPGGTYLATLQGVEPAKTRFGDAFKWHWLLPAAGNFELVQMTSTSTTGGSRGGQNIKALRGRGLPPGERLPTAEIVGKSATLELSVDPESSWNRVESVHPAAPPLSAAAVEHYAAVADATEPPHPAETFEARFAAQTTAAQTATFAGDVDALPFP